MSRFPPQPSTRVHELFSTPAARQRSPRVALYSGADATGLAERRVAFCSVRLKGVSPGPYRRRRKGERLLFNALFRWPKGRAAVSGFPSGRTCSSWERSGRAGPLATAVAASSLARALTCREIERSGRINARPAAPPSSRVPPSACRRGAITSGGATAYTTTAAGQENFGARYARLCARITALL